MNDDRPFGAFVCAMAAAAERAVASSSITEDTGLLRWRLGEQCLEAKSNIVLALEGDAGVLALLHVHFQLGLSDADAVAFRRRWVY